MVCVLPSAVILNLLFAGVSRVTVHRATSALLYKADNRTVLSDEAASKNGHDVSENPAEATSFSPRKKSGSAASAKETRASSSSGTRSIVGFQHYRSMMETVDDIQKSTSGISREKYVETLMGCVDAQHAAKTDPKLLSR